MKIKKIHPMFTSVVTTANRYVGDQYEEKNGLIIDTRKMDGALNNFQTVLAVGPHAGEVKPGDVVYLNFNRYALVKHTPGKLEDNIETDNMSYTYQIPMVDIDGQKCLRVQVNDIEYFMEPGDYEVDEGGLFQ